MTHLLPGSGVPRVHRARSPVPPRLPHFATPRSVHQFAAVAAGAYPLRRPPNAWPPGAPALPGPCYWLVASGTALGLGRGAVRHYCQGGCSALVVCAQHSRPVWGARAGTWSCVFPVYPFPPHASCAVCGGPSCPGVPYPRSLVRHSMRSVRSAGSVRLPFWYFPRVLCVCVRSRSRGVRSIPPPLVGVARAPRAVPVLGAGRAVPRGPCPSPCASPVPCSVWLAWGGGAARSRFPPTWLGAVRSPWGGSGALARVGLFSVVPAETGGWGVGAGPAPASLSGAAVLPGGGGIIPSASGGWGLVPPQLAGRWGGVGGQEGGVA